MNNISNNYREWQMAKNNEILEQGKDWIGKKENQATVKKYALISWGWLKGKVSKK